MATRLYAIFFLTGASSLAFEALWFHQAGLALGNSVWASSLVLAGFMAGLALGNALAGRLGDRVGRPILAYAVLEAAIALTGVALVYTLPLLGPGLAGLLGPLLERPWILNPLRLGVAFSLLVIPSTAMGATLPLLTRALADREPDFGRVLGRLYGWNTFGAVIGVVATEAFLVGALGIRGAAWSVGALNAGAAVVASWLAFAAPRTAPAAKRTQRDRGGARLLAVAFGAGFCLLALEVVWFRVLTLFVLSTTWSFALMLGCVLAGIALGGLVASEWLRRLPHAHRLVAPIAFAAGAACLASYAALPLVLPEPGGPLLRGWQILGLGLPLMFPVSFLSGLLFTLLGAGLRQARASASATAGGLTFANTVGAALGSLAGGFVLLPALGMENSLFAIGLTYGALATALLWRGSVPRVAVYVGAGGLALAAALFPFGTMESHHLVIPVRRFVGEGEGRVVQTRETPSETIIYVEQRVLGEPISYRMLTNGFSMSATFLTARRYMKLYVYLPVAIHPQLERALLISYGVGSTAKALTDSTNIRAIDVVDISREVLELNSIVYPDAASHPLEDPRVRVHIEDGRYFLQTTPQRFDLITGEPPPPVAPGVVNLYTREYFELLRSRLADGGMVTYWLPVNELAPQSTKAILRAFCAAFADCSLWHGMGSELMMVGTRGAEGAVSAAHFGAQWSDPVVSREMRALGFERPEQLGALFIGDSNYLRELTADTPPLVDDQPKRIAGPDWGKEYPALYEGFADVTKARERFLRSEFIAALWPEVLREETLPYFDFQEVINAVGNGFWASRNRFEYLHEILTRSSLREPARWLLNSDDSVEQIVDGLTPAQRRHPVVQLYLGIAKVAERRYGDAAENLARAEASSQLQLDAFRLRIYALSMAGRVEEAERLARERYAAVAQGEPLPEFWLWMGRTFGLDPRHPTVALKP